MSHIRVSGCDSHYKLPFLPGHVCGLLNSNDAMTDLCLNDRTILAALDRFSPFVARYWPRSNAAAEINQKAACHGKTLNGLPNGLACPAW
jgi:hypothetical protein